MFARLALALSLLLAACGSTPARHAVPADALDLARIPGIPKARGWGDRSPDLLGEVDGLSPGELAEAFPAAFGAPHHYLALSGGGPNGAYGVGLLVGWTQSGTRPEFTIVTGVSTGAFIAPFAFLGPEYDDRLERAYTSYSTEDFFERKSLLSALTGDAALDTEPLRQTIAELFDQEMLDAVAREHRRGRRLLIGTTNLDAARPVIWNLGEIAVSGAPDALELARAVILASASIPVAFPPVLFEVEVDGERHDEMHVDGLASSQVFLYPSGLDWSGVLDRLQVTAQPKLYVIRNGVLETLPIEVQPKLSAIAAQSISSMMLHQANGDLYRMYLTSVRDGIDFHLAALPAEAELQVGENWIDPVAMRELFELGRAHAAQGNPWAKAPPGFEALSLGGAQLP